jgi:hypothetical protein
VTGGRDFCESVTSKGEPRDRDLYMAERQALGFALDAIGPTKIIHGGAKGADRWAGIWADKRGVECHVEPATGSWPQAGPIRNQRMVDTKPDAAVRFPGERGTADCAGRCERACIPVYEVTVR